MKIIKHMKRVLIHKYYVLKFSIKAGIILRGLLHDNSKFHPIELIESVKFYNEYKSPILEAKKSLGYSKAWLHHRHINKHHWEYWAGGFGSKEYGIRMPWEYNMELICDYLAASVTYSKDKKLNIEDEYNWWINSNLQDNKFINKKTFLFTNEIFEIMHKESNLDILNKKRTKELYLKFN